MFSGAHHGQIIQQQFERQQMSSLCRAVIQHIPAWPLSHLQSADTLHGFECQQVSEDKTPVVSASQPGMLTQIILQHSFMSPTISYFLLLDSNCCFYRESVENTLLEVKLSV